MFDSQHSQCETSHDANGVMTQHFANGYTVATDFPNGVSRIIKNGKEVNSFSLSGISHNEFAQRIEKIAKQ